MIEHFHFLRPLWLLALPLLALLLWLLRRRGYDSGSWRAVIDPRLLPHLLGAATQAGASRMPWIVATVVALAIVALAGPTWEQRAQSVYQQQSALVIALDLSRSMDAADIRPSRLTRARHKIADMLALRTEGQTALLVYAAAAFTVTPLTSDVDTILTLLPDLQTDLMPSQGTRADRALEQAQELLRNSGVERGDVLLVTDGVSDLEIASIEKILRQNAGLRLSVLAIGTREGGPVPLNNGDFLKRSNGDIVIVKMNTSGLQRIAAASGGAFTTLSADDLDVNTLNYVMESRIGAGESQLSDRSTDLWRELGPGLLLLALPLAALAFRRGLLWAVPLCLLLVPPEADAFDWQALWSNDNQRALQLYQQGEHAAAAELFADDDWQASARYRAGDYAAAVEKWGQSSGLQAAYNHATALARQGQYEAALAAYDRLLEQHPQHEDASYNRQAIEDWLQQQQQQDSQQQDSQQQEGESGDQGEAQQQSQRESGQSGASDESDQGQSAGADEQPWEQNRQGSQANASEASQADSAGEQEQQQQQDSTRQTPGDEQAAEEQSGEQQAASAEDLANLEQQMSEQAAQQWLRKIPDDPGGLLRRKFRYQYRQRGSADTEEQAW